MRAKGLVALALLGLILLAACALGRPGPAPAAANTAVRLALMPLEDFGEETGGAFQVQGLLGRELPRRGYEIADEAQLKRLLLRERVRRTGAVGRELGRAIQEGVGAPLIWLGAVTQYRTGPDPCLSVVARVVEARSGRILWSGAASATGSQFQWVLGLGKIEDVSQLCEVVVGRLLGDLPPGAVLLQASRAEEPR